MVIALCSIGVLHQIPDGLYPKKNNFKVFGYYRIVLGIIVLFYFG